VISLVSLSGIVGHFAGGDSVPAALVVWFFVGSLGGMIAGTAVGKRLAGRRLQQIFAMLIVAVGVFMIARNLIWN